MGNPINVAAATAGETFTPKFTEDPAPTPSAATPPPPEEPKKPKQPSDANEEKGGLKTVYTTIALVVLALMFMGAGLYQHFNQLAARQAADARMSYQQIADQRAADQVKNNVDTLNVKNLIAASSKFQDIEVTGTATINNLLAQAIKASQLDATDTTTETLVVRGATATKTLNVDGTTTLAGLTSDGLVKLTGKGGDVLIIQAQGPNQSLVSVRNADGGEVTNLDSSGNLALGGNLSVAGVLNVPTANITNLTATNATLGNISIGGQSVFTATPSGSAVNQGTVYINPATVGNAADTLLGLAVAGVEKLRVDASGNLANAGNLSVAGTASIGSQLTVGGNQIVNGTLTAGATTLNSLGVTNNAAIGGGLTVNGASALNGNTTIGDSISDTVNFVARLGSDLIPVANISQNLGSVSNYFGSAYVGDVYANNIYAANTTISGTTAANFTINSDNVSNDTESSYLTFFRGVAPDNAVFGWNATNQRFELNHTTAVTTGNFAVTNGNLNVSGTSSFGGNVAVNTNKFTVDATTGNTAVAGTLTVTSDVNTFGVYQISGTGVLKRQSNGAIILGDITGDSRGSNSLDLQSSRSASTQVASGDGTVAVGINNTAATLNSSAIGFSNIATGQFSPNNAVGANNTANGLLYADAFGNLNTATSYNSTSFGLANNATSVNTSAFGQLNNATSTEAQAFGRYNQAVNFASKAFGGFNSSYGNSASAFGGGNVSTGDNSNAFGTSNTTSGANSSAFGYSNTVSGNNSTAVGASSRVGNVARSFTVTANGTTITIAGGNYTTEFVNGDTAVFINAAGPSGTSNIGDVTKVISGSTFNSGPNTTTFTIPTAIDATSTSGKVVSQSIAQRSGTFGYTNTVSANDAYALGSNLTNSVQGSVMIGTTDAGKVTILSNGNVGIGTTAPGAKLEVTTTGTVGIKTSGATQYGIDAFSDAGLAVYGHSNSGSGLYGTSTSGVAIDGASTSNYGVRGTSSSSYGVRGTSTSSFGLYGTSGTGYGLFGGSTSGSSALFQSLQAANTSPTVVVQQNGSGTADLLQVQNSSGTVLAAFNSTGQLVFGPAGSQDTNLYRSAADTLKTDDSLTVAGSGNGSTTYGALFKNTADSATAFDIQTQGGTSILSVNSSTLTVTVKALVVSTSLTVNGHIITGDAAVSGATPNTGNAGSGATCVITGNQTSGTITLTSGTSTLLAGTQCTATISYTSSPRPVVSGANAVSAALAPFISASTSTLTFGFGVAPAPSTVYTFNYFNAQ